MDVIKNEIKEAVEKELTAACERFPMFASLHEGVAVIFEEYQEASEALTAVQRYLELTWRQIRGNNKTLTLNHLTRVKTAAEHLAIEACQVAAMCEKAIQSANNPVNVKDIEDKHWSECMQIAHYENELKEALYWLNYYTNGEYGRT